jgi:hypothetical protein
MRYHKKTLIFSGTFNFQAVQLSDILFSCMRLMYIDLEPWDDGSIGRGDLAAAWSSATSKMVSFAMPAGDATTVYGGVSLLIGLSDLVPSPMLNEYEAVCLCGENSICKRRPYIEEMAKSQPAQLHIHLVVDLG